MSGPGTGPDTATAATPLRDPRILILDTSIRILYPSILVLALYFVFSGHNRPGGGFVGGLVVGAALALRYVSGGAQPRCAPRSGCTRT